MPNFYARLRESRGDDDELAACIERVVHQLEDVSTTSDRPGILLGKIQSGKTRGFVGVIARSFDRGFDVAVILTKGTKTLSAQTVARLRSDFSEFLDDDELLIFDIMAPPGRLTRGELGRKLVIVAKKQADNLRRLTEFISTTYPSLRDRRTLLVDDEADLASIRFVKRRGQQDVEQGRIAEQMDDLRRDVPNLAFLQVTATPYSLYLQPEDYDAHGGNFVFKPKKPAFTELLPIHSGYVGGDDYFATFDANDPRSRLIVEVDVNEQDALRRRDQRRISKERVLDTPNTAGLRRAILTFALGVCLRRWQQHELGEKKRKYAMIIHNDTQRTAHGWQEEVISWILEAIREAAEQRPQVLRPLFQSAYNDLSASVQADRGRMPDETTAFNMLIEALASDDVVLERVNSDRDVMALLDEKAELRLRTPYNIYVGGNILDRGITVPNLIAFYYGRNPQLMQADTVLQHARMYGNRDRRDLAVTRFYSSRAVYDRLYVINEFENALRHAFESGAHERGVVFIQTDPDSRVRPCAPNKVLLSDVVAVRPNGLYLPTGFTTVSATALRQPLARLDQLIPADRRNLEYFVTITREDALEIIGQIEKTLVVNEASFEWEAMRGLLEYYSSLREGGDGSVLFVAATGRRLNRQASGDKSGLSILGGGPLRQLVVGPGRSKPALIALQQTGTVELGWSGSPFWWPILAAPATAEPCVFASKVAA